MVKRFNETEILGDKVFMSWYRDLRRARPFNDHRQQYGGGGRGRDDYHHRRPMSRYENPRNRKFTRSRSRSKSKSRSRSGSSGSRSGGSSERSQEMRRKNYGDGQWNNKWKHSNEKRRHMKSFDRNNEGEYSDDSSKERIQINKRPKQMFQSKVVAVNNNNSKADSLNTSLDTSYNINKEDNNTMGNNNNTTISNNNATNYIPMNINNNSKWGEVGRGGGGSGGGGGAGSGVGGEGVDKKVLDDSDKSVVLEKKTSQWTPINEKASVTTLTTNNNNNNIVESNNQEDVLLGLRKQQLQKHLKEVLLKEAILKEQQILQQDHTTSIPQPQHQQQNHSKQQQQLIDNKQQKQYEDLDGVDISNNNKRFVEQHKQQNLTKVDKKQQVINTNTKKQLPQDRNRSITKDHQQQLSNNSNNKEQQNFNNNNTNPNVSAMMMMMKKKKKEKYQPFIGNEEVGVLLESHVHDDDVDDSAYYDYNNKSKTLQQPVDKRKRHNITSNEVMMMSAGVVGDNVDNEDGDGDVGASVQGMVGVVGGKMRGRGRVLGQDKLMLVKKKKEEIEKNYSQDCATFSLVTKLLISKDTELEDRLQKSLRENLREIGHRSIQELKEFVERLKKEGDGVNVDDDEEEDDDEDDGIPLDQLF